MVQLQSCLVGLLCQFLCRHLPANRDGGGGERARAPLSLARPLLIWGSVRFCLWGHPRRDEEDETNERTDERGYRRNNAKMALGKLALIASKGETERGD